jgi:S-DNA-T family DNA segregation ATPase FtsK/SpoIIIE
MWSLGIQPPRESGLAPVDVVVRAQPQATVADLAAALGRHLAPDRDGLLAAPVRDGVTLPATQPLGECGLRSGDLLDVAPVPQSWLVEPGAEIRHRAFLRVVAGPDAGMKVGLAGEAATIGRTASCTLVLSDPLVSRRHARLLLTPRPLLVDDGSAHGTTAAGTPVTRPTRIEFGTPIQLGDSVVVLEAGTGGTAGTGAHSDDAVLRPPRFGEPLDSGPVEAPAPPTKPKPPMMPWMMLAMPLMMGVALFGMARSAYFLVYMLGYPVIVLAGWLYQRHRAKKEYQAALRLWRADLRELLARLDRNAAVQRDRAASDHPDCGQLPRRVRARHRLLWTRRPGDDDFLACRVGLGPVPALLSTKLRDGGEREVRAEARQALATRRILADLPVLLPLVGARVAAVVGPAERVDAAARAVLLRLCCDHSPAELSVAAVLGPDRATHETWLRWLPHASRRIGGLAPVAVGAADGSELLEQLAAEDVRGAVICVVDAGAGIHRRQLEAVAPLTRTGEGGGGAAADRLRLLWLGSNPDTVPAATDLLVDLTNAVPAPNAAVDAAAAGIETAAAAVLARRDRASVDRLTSVDQVSLATAWQVARAMTNYTDEVALRPPETALPQVVRLPQVLGLDDPDSAGEVLERWAARRGLRAPVGIGVDGVVTVDLREDGPHGLVAGTTGAGKSELLQTLICALAVSNPPERISFLLVDYKGGAAFRECADLPHTVGYITDLTPALVARALTSLSAELAAREELLAQFGAKDLVALEREHPASAPPSLLICVDEFAALVAEVPDFVDGMVNVAQRGRSLGMHLVLATQRPAGVITANIRANTDLRIALRVASTDDSVDVLDRRDAAQISRRTPGRAWVRRTGHGTDELVQAAFVGARSQIGSDQLAVEVEPFTVVQAPSAGPGAAPRLHPRSDLERLVTTVGEAFVRSGRPVPARPWLPPLPEVLCFGMAGGELVFGGAGGPGLDRSGTDPGAARSAPGTARDAVRAPVAPGRVPVGLVDQPSRRAQPPLVLDYPQVGHVLVYGASGSGKTELLRTVAVTAALAGAEAPFVYAIDCGGGGLLSLSDWPAVGAVIPESDLGRIMRLVRMLRHTVTDRNRTLATVGAADAGALAAAGHPLARIHLLIDNLPALVEALEGSPVLRQHSEQLAAVLADGRRVGVHVTATTPRRGGIPSAMQAAFGERLVLRMTVEDDYGLLGVPSRVLTGDSPPGRGLIGRHELQVATLTGADAPPPAQRMAQLAELVPGYRGEDEGAGVPARRPPVTVPGMPTRVPEQVLPAPRRDRVAIGVEADFVAVVTVSLTQAPLLVAGRSRSGRTGMLAGIARQARRSDLPASEVVLIGARAAAEAGDYDRVLTDPEKVVAYLPDLARPPAGGAGAWRLVLIDDAHLWEREWESGGAARDAVAGLGTLVGGSGAGLAVVVATDLDDARSRAHVPGAVTVAKRSRRGILLQPEFADGGVLSISVPSHVVEPITGAGRGLYCADGSVQVIQVVSGAEGGR